MRQQIYNELRRTGDFDLAFWLVDGLAGESPLAKCQTWNLHGPSPIYFIDQFHGNYPSLLHLKGLNAGTVNLNIAPGLMLDANVVNYLHAFRTNAKDRNSAWDAALLKLIEHTDTENWDFNAFFYLIEAALKMGQTAFDTYVPLELETILTIQNIDSTALKRGVIQTDPKRLADHLRAMGQPTLEAAAKAMANNARNDLRLPEFGLLSEVSAVLCVKMVILNNEALAPDQKLDLFYDFMLNDLGFVALREAALAELHFGGAAGGLLPGPGSKRANVEKNIRSTSWDLTMLRIPELLVTQEVDGAYPLVAICTCENGLAALGGMFQAEVIRFSQSRPGEITPGYTFDPKPLIANVGQTMYHAMERVKRKWLTARPLAPASAAPTRAKVASLYGQLITAIS